MTDASNIPQVNVDHDGIESRPQILRYSIAAEKQGQMGRQANPIVHIKVKYLPYQALRQQFWRAMLKHYDDDTELSTRLRSTTMLDTPGSTLHEDTINSWFRRFSYEWRRKRFRLWMSSDVSGGSAYEIPEEGYLADTIKELHISETKTSKLTPPTAQSHLTVLYILKTAQVKNTFKQPISDLSSSST